MTKSPPVLSDQVMSAVRRFEVLALALEREGFPDHAIRCGADATVEKYAEREDRARKDVVR